MKWRSNHGFTLLEVMLVVVILTMLASAAVPRLTASSENARKKVDINTGREVKAALDRFQIERGNYPQLGQLSAKDGKVEGLGFVPEFFRKLDATVTQQNASPGQRGFGIEGMRTDNNYTSPTNLIMIYLERDGSGAEVQVFDKTLTEVLWSSM